MLHFFWDTLYMYMYILSVIDIYLWICVSVFVYESLKMFVSVFCICVCVFEYSYLSICIQVFVFLYLYNVFVFVYLRIVVFVCGRRLEEVGLHFVTLIHFISTFLPNDCYIVNHIDQFCSPRPTLSSSIRFSWQFLTSCELLILVFGGLDWLIGC